MNKIKQTILSSIRSVEIIGHDVVHRLLARSVPHSHFVGWQVIFSVHSILPCLILVEQSAVLDAIYLLVKRSIRDQGTKWNPCILPLTLTVFETNRRFHVCRQLWGSTIFFQKRIQCVLLTFSWFWLYQITLFQVWIFKTFLERARRALPQSD